MTRRPLLFKEKKKRKGKTHLPLLVEKREIHFVTLYSSNTKSKTHFFSFFFNKCKGNRERERPVFLPIHCWARRRIFAFVDGLLSRTSLHRCVEAR
jgi:hypothetical protein